MFQFPSFASYIYFTQHRIMSISTHGVAPFGYVRVKARLAALRTLSWPSPSFIASHVPRHPSRAFSRLSWVIISASLSAHFNCKSAYADSHSYSSILFRVLRIKLKDLFVVLFLKQRLRFIGLSKEFSRNHLRPNSFPVFCPCSFKQFRSLNPFQSLKTESWKTHKVPVMLSAFAYSPPDYFFLIYV